MPEEEGKPFLWSPEKNNQLRADRGINFETVVKAIEDGKVLDIIEHPQ